MNTFDDAGVTIAPDLGPAERLLWSGRPRQGIILRASDVVAIPFSLLWGGFAIAWEAAAVFGTAHAPPDKMPAGFALIFPLFGVPFVVIGLYMIFGRFIADKLQRQKTAYAVTNQRIIIRSGLFSTTVKSLQLRTLSDVSLTEHSNNRGTITFGQTNPFHSIFGSTSWPGAGQYAPPNFDSIEDAKRVFEIIRTAQSQA